MPNQESSKCSLCREKITKILVRCNKCIMDFHQECAGNHKIYNKENVLVNCENPTETFILSDVEQEKTSTQPDQLSTQSNINDSNQTYEWQQVRKRSRNSPGNGQKTKQQTKLDYWLNLPSTSTSNKFTVLENKESVENKETAPENSTETLPKPPPLFIAGVKNINPLTQLLNSLIKDKYFLKVLNQDQVKIQAQTMETYDIIEKALKEKNTEFHSYQKKSERVYKTVLKNLHPSTDIKLLKEEIELHGHKVVRINNIRRKPSKSNTYTGPLPMFYVDLQSNINNKEIYNIEFLLNTKIKFEAPFKKREIPQCTRCQRYFHTKNFCHRQPRCVKCAEDHDTKDCPKRDRSDFVKCVLCEGNHPANYKGCTVYKDLQRQTFPPLRNKESHQNAPNENRREKRDLNHEQSENISQHVRSEHQLQIPLTTNLKNSYSHITKNGTVDTKHNQNSDISELKNMMRNLMQQMTTMLNLLTTLVAKMS